MRRQFRFSWLAAALLALAVLPAAQARAQTSPASPRLRFLPNTAHLVVAGDGWPAGDRVAFIVRVDGRMQGTELRTTTADTFAVEVSAVSLCDRPYFLATDLYGNQAELHGPPLGCAQRFPVPLPILTVTEGTPLRVHVVHLKPGARTVTIRRGNVLDVSRAASPGITVQTDERYLPPYGESLSPVAAVRSCTITGCAHGVPLRFIAVRHGRTTMTFAPLCAKSTPPCLEPDRVVEVRITH